MAATIKIVLVDDHPVLRNGLRYTIQTQPDMSVVGEAGDGRSALEVIAQHQPDLVLMDISMPGADGIEVSRQIRLLHPHVKIIILSGLSDEQYVSRTIQAGLEGYLLKGNATTELIFAIRAAIKGQTFLSPEVTTSVMTAYKGFLSHQNRPASLLSEREMEVLKLIAQGVRTKEIASQLKIGSKTVDTYRARLMAKLHCHSTTELVRYAIRQGIASV